MGKIAKFFRSNLAGTIANQPWWAVLALKCVEVRFSTSFNYKLPASGVMPNVFRLFATFSCLVNKFPFGLVRNLSFTNSAQKVIWFQVGNTDSKATVFDIKSHAAAEFLRDVIELVIGWSPSNLEDSHDQVKVKLIDGVNNLERFEKWSFGAYPIDDDCLLNRQRGFDCCVEAIFTMLY